LLSRPVWKVRKDKKRNEGMLRKDKKRNVRWRSWCDTVKLPEEKNELR